MGSPQLSSAISPTTPFFPLQGHVDMVSNALPLLAALLSKDRALLCCGEMLLLLYNGMAL